MEQIFHIIQQVYYMLKILSNYSPNEREELIKEFKVFLAEIVDILSILSRVVDWCTYWGWKFDCGHHPWQLRTYHQQKGLTLQAGWEDRVDFEIPVYRNIEYQVQQLPSPQGLARDLIPIDLDALEESEGRLVLMFVRYAIYLMRNQ